MPALAVNSRGQGVLEAVLLLLVVTAVTLGVVYQFNDAFRNYLTQYFNGYVRCLIETGEIPQLGAEEGSVCGNVYQSFNVQDGAVGPGGGNPIGQGGSSNTQPGDGSSGDSSNNRRTAGRSSGGSVAEGGGGGGIARSGGRFAAGAPRIGVGIPGGGKKPIHIESGGQDGYGGVSGASQSYRVIYIDEDSRKSEIQLDKSLQLSAEKSKTETEKSLKKKSVTVGQDARGAKKAQPIYVNQRELARAEEVTESEELTFTSFFKWLFIAAILIALFVFLGGQVMQVSKNWQ